MLIVRNGTIYMVKRFRTGYYVCRFPRYDDPELIASHLKTIPDAIKIIEEDSKNA